MKPLNDILAAITAGACAAVDWADQASVCLTSRAAWTPWVVEASAEDATG